MADNSIPKGGAFLLQPGSLDACFTPEDLSEEHRMMLQTTKDFVAKEVDPNIEKIEAKDAEFVKALLANAGELGLLGTDVPEEFGGMGLDKMSTCIVTDAMGNAASFAVAFGAHTGIGTLPIVYFGNQAQKEKYLPDLPAARNSPPTL